MPRLTPFGYNRNTLTMTIPGVGCMISASAVNFMLSYTMGYACELEKMDVVTTTVGTGTSASRVVNVRKGSATGTPVGTATLTLANQGTLAVVTAGTVTVAGGVNKFTDTDTLTVEFPTGGTAFTAGGVVLMLTFRILNAKAV